VGVKSPPMLSNSLGEPVPGFVTLLSTAVSNNLLSISSGVAEGSAAWYKATTPAVCGEAMDVPFLLEYPPPVLVDLIPEPGANMSTQVPQLEKPDRPSLLMVEPTVTAFSEEAGL